MSEMIELILVLHFLYCVCAPYPLMPSAKLQAVSSFKEPEISAPFAVILAIWYYEMHRLEHDRHEGWVRKHKYLIDGAGVSVEQHAERILEDRTRLSLGKRVFLTFHGLPQKGLGDVSAVSGCESRGRVCDTE